MTTLGKNASPAYRQAIGGRSVEEESEEKRQGLVENHPIAHDTGRAIRVGDCSAPRSIDADRRRGRQGPTRNSACQTPVSVAGQTRGKSCDRIGNGNTRSNSRAHHSAVIVINSRGTSEPNNLSAPGNRPRRRSRRSERQSIERSRIPHPIDRYGLMFQATTIPTVAGFAGRGRRRRRTRAC